MTLSRTLALTLVFTAACGADTTPAPTGPTATQACTALAQAECARRDACSNRILIGRVYGDLATCEQRVRDAFVTSLAARLRTPSPWRSATRDGADGRTASMAFVPARPPCTSPVSRA